MSDAVLLAAIPITLSVILVWLRLKRPIYWWSSLGLCLAIVATSQIVVASNWRVALGGLLIYGLPVSAMFLGLRFPLFEQKRWLILPIGMGLYLIGMALALSINVSAGLIQP